MRRSFIDAAGWVAACFAGAVATALPVQSEETIYSLDDEAACRDMNGRITPPRIAPTPPLVAEKTSFGMVKVKGGMKGRECFFYTFEVGLDPPKTPGSTLCPDASVGHEKSVVAGTRDKPGGCSK
jgi:hypothetical protein